MTTYLIAIRKDSSQSPHSEGSPQEAACEIARDLLGLRGRADQLIAIERDTPLATFSLIKDDVLCSIQVTKQSLDTWREDVVRIRTAFINFNLTKDQAETQLTQALDDLDYAFGASEALKEFVPSDEISVYGVLDELGISDMEMTFQRALSELYKFKPMETTAVWEA